MKNTTYKKEKEEYSSKRELILTMDAEPSFYKKWKLEAYPREKELEEKMKEIREEYRKRHEEMQNAFPPAQPFYKAKATIENCDLFSKVFREMPKGGLLHVHSSAALSVEELLNMLKQWVEETDKEHYPEIYIVVKEDVSQTKAAVGTLLYDFQMETEGLAKYAEPLGEYLKSSYNCEWLKELLSFSSDRIKQYPYVWDEFQTIFSRTRRLFVMETFYYNYHVRLFEECIADKIYYVELRCGYEELKETAGEARLMQEKEKAGDRTYVHYKNYTYHRDMNLRVNPYEPDAGFLEILQCAEKEVQKTVNKNFRLKVILCAVRALDPVKDLEKIISKVDAAIVLQREEKYKDLIIGFDFVSEEDRGKTTAEYVDSIIYESFGRGYKDEATIEKMEALRQKYGTEERIKMIDFYLHDGESNWNDNCNVVDAAIISRYRIGHGFNMHKMQGCVQDIAFLNRAVEVEPKEPVLEICPISNQLLDYYPDLRNHPANELMRQGIFCCVCNDDPQILGNPGLSYDFWEMYVGLWLDLETIKGLAYTAYHYYGLRGLNIGEEEVIKEQFMKEWKSFVDTALQKLSEA